MLQWNVLFNCYVLGLLREMKNESTQFRINKDIFSWKQDFFHSIYFENFSS